MEIRIPPLSESVSTATLMAWHKQEGDFVERDEILIEVETDKVVFEIPAPAAGRLTRIVKPPGAAGETGRGGGGRVTKADVLAAAETKPKPPAITPVLSGVEGPPATATVSHTSDGRPEQRAPISRLRLRIAERLLEPKRSHESVTSLNE